MARTDEMQTKAAKPQQDVQEPQLTLDERVIRYRRIDAPLFIIILVMLAYGLIMLFSAGMADGYASQGGNPLFYFTSQLKFIVMGLVAMAVLIMVPVKLFDQKVFMVLVYLITTVLLVLVIVAGRQGYGAVRWLNLFGLVFQPSEVAKIASVYCLATYYSFLRRWRELGPLPWRWPSLLSWRDPVYDVVIPAAAMGLWLLLIFIQPHVSGTVILFLLVLSVMLIVGVPARSWGRGLAILIPAGIIGLVLVGLILEVATDKSLFSMIAEKFAHAFIRLNTYASPDTASDDALRQIVQARYALGAGGLTGLGLGLGRQKMAYLPMIYNDYILPSIGEELGYIGVMAVILLFMLFLYRGLKIARHADGVFTACLAHGYTFLIVLQALLNIAVAAEVIPATGISLPFFSSGGTSNVFFLVACGLILAVSRTGQRVDAETRQLMKKPKYKKRRPATAPAVRSNMSAERTKRRRSLAPDSALRRRQRSSSGRPRGGRS